MLADYTRLIRHLSPEELKLFKDSFKPKKPHEWDKDPNTWLNTSQLNLIRTITK